MARLSPAQQHLQRHFAAEAIKKSLASNVAADRAEDGPEATAYDLLRAQLGEHMRQLLDTASTELKIDMKRIMLPEYDDHIDTVLLTALDTGKAVQDEVFVRLMIWHFDCGLYSRALEMAEHVLTYGLTLPENFKRSPASLITELVADAALDALTQKHPFDIEILRQTEALVTGFDMHDIVAAKLNKAYGLIYLQIASVTDTPDGPAGGPRAARELAQKHFLRAMQLDKNIGVKTHLRDLERALKADV